MITYQLRVSHGDHYGDVDSDDPKLRSTPTNLSGPELAVDAGRSVVFCTFLIGKKLAGLLQVKANQCARIRLRFNDMNLSLNFRPFNNLRS